MLDGDSILARIARYDLPWQSAWKTSFAEFADRYTLHDSIWIGILLPLSEGNEAILAIEWDAYWLPDADLRQCGDGPRASVPWPFLVMRIFSIRNLSFAGFEQELSQRAISEAVHSQFEDVQAVEFYDILGDGVRIEYSGMIEILGLRKSDGQLLELATTPKRSSTSQDQDA